MKKITVLHVISGLSLGGAEMMLFKLLKNIDDNRFDSIVVSLTSNGDLAPKIRELKIPVYFLNMKKGVSSFKAVTEYRNIILKYRPDIIQAWMYHANVFSAIMKALTPKHYLLFNIRTSLSNVKINKVITRSLIWANAKLSKISNGIINNSKLSIEQHKKIGFRKDKNFYIPNGFDLCVFKPNQAYYEKFREQYNLKRDCKLVGLFARYHQCKNHKGFLKVAKILLENCSKENISIKFVLAGEGCDKSNNELIREIEEQNLSKHVLLLGKVNSAEVLPCLDIHLLTSYEEGFPNAIGEAMSCGIPCISSNVGDCKNIISRFGGVAEINDYTSLAKISFEALDFKAENKKEIREYIYKNYSIKKIVNEYEKLYSGIINQKESW